MWVEFKCVKKKTQSFLVYEKLAISIKFFNKSKCNLDVKTLILVVAPAQ